MNGLRVVSLTQTCGRSPAQWEGRLDDDRPIFIRYRHGNLTVQLGEPGAGLDGALDAPPWFDRELVIDGDHAAAPIDRVAEITGLMIDCTVESL
ncbi:MAG: hypothetical protein EON91_10750 [Brevundimonas sp.]|uniref:hypothetical protein n=1 Tax=Brevundimonas sp. TaxID=1871086 RepID=UPI0012174343|nr:hypothetical protein [Brevundimonas sp.]RZJ17087.1 MAG: hypothetical protein EON91_10750 [Brevundimonas sp.]